ncbi:hypothetical protein HanPSC8_Chr16g0738871 [Helianthus annuus]|nr:hypothetical protein HanPSC8_Chr16g0738871 [Helianthus annuus]
MFIVFFFNMKQRDLCVISIHRRRSVLGCMYQLPTLIPIVYTGFFPPNYTICLALLIPPTYLHRAYANSGSFSLFNVRLQRCRHCCWNVMLMSES